MLVPENSNVQAVTKYAGVVRAGVPIERAKF